MTILKKIVPTEKESRQLKKKVHYFINNIKTQGIIFLGGSYAKNTYLRGKYDIDIFIKYDYEKFKNKNISRILERELKPFHPQKIHGSRDYFQVELNGIHFEIVPVLDIEHSSQAQNVTDISPLHTAWVRKHLGHLHTDVRLLKQFCKAHHLYGAESYIRGFSGYTLEILTIHYGSFKNIITHATSWKPHEMIDVAHHYEHRNPLHELNPSKISPLIVIDPVQKERNAAAALSEETFRAFVTLCQEYLKGPPEKFFKEKKFSITAFRGYTVLEVTPLSGKKDVVGAKLLRCYQQLKRLLLNEKILLRDAGWSWNDKVYFYFKSKKILPYKIHYGPPLPQEEHNVRFRAKWKKYKMHKRKNKTYVKIPRKYTTLSEFLKRIVQHKHFLRYVKNMKIKDHKV